MSREAKLLPRLWQSLDTLDADADIANTVRRIREYAGKNAFSERAGGDRLMLDSVGQLMRVELRKLGFLIGRYRLEDPEVDAARARVEAALIDGTSIAGVDMLCVLVLLNRVIRELMANQVRLAQAIATPSAGQGMNDALRASLDGLVRAMGDA